MARVMASMYFSPPSATVFFSGGVSVGPGQSREVTLPVGRGLRYYDTYLHVLHLRSRRGAPLPDGRPVGAFVEIRLEMGPPNAPPAAP